MQQRKLNIGILIGDVPTDPEFSPTLRPNYHLAVSLKQQLPGSYGPICDGKRKPACFHKYVSEQAAYRYNLRTFSLSFHNSTQLISQWQKEVRGSASYHLVAAAFLPSSTTKAKQQLQLRRTKPQTSGHRDAISSSNPELSLSRKGHRQREQPVQQPSYPLLLLVLDVL